MLGVERGVLAGRPISRFIVPENLGVYHVLHQQLLETHELQACELRMFRADGAVFWVQLTACADVALAMSAPLHSSAEPQLLRPGHVLYWNDLAPQTCFVIPLLKTAAQARAPLDAGSGPG